MSWIPVRFKTPEDRYDCYLSVVCDGAAGHHQIMGVFIEYNSVKSGDGYLPRGWYHNHHFLTASDRIAGEVTHWRRAEELPDISQEDPWVGVAELDYVNFISQPFEAVWPQIEAEFDWKNVYKAMKLLDWHWQDWGIPSVRKLKATAFELAKRSWETKKGGCTGGFTVGWDSGIFYVTFELEAAVVEM